MRTFLSALFTLVLAGCGTGATSRDMSRDGAVSCSGVASDGTPCSCEGASRDGPCGACALDAYAHKSCTCTNGRWACIHVDCSPFCRAGEVGVYLDLFCSFPRRCQDAGSDGGSDGADLR